MIQIGPGSTIKEITEQHTQKRERASIARNKKPYQMCYKDLIPRTMKYQDSLQQKKLISICYRKGSPNMQI